MGMAAVSNGGEGERGADSALSELISEERTDEL